MTKQHQNNDKISRDRDSKSDECIYWTVGMRGDSLELPVWGVQGSVVPGPGNDRSWGAQGGTLEGHGAAWGHGLLDGRVPQLGRRLWTGRRKDRRREWEELMLKKDLYICENDRKKAVSSKRFIYIWWKHAIPFLSHFLFLSIYISLRYSKENCLPALQWSKDFHLNWMYWIPSITRVLYLIFVKLTWVTDLHGGSVRERGPWRVAWGLLRGRWPPPEGERRGPGYNTFITSCHTQKPYPSPDEAQMDEIRQLYRKYVIIVTYWKYRL